MSLRRTYGKQRRLGAKLQDPVEFSPTKKNNLGSQTLSSDSEDSIDTEDVQWRPKRENNIGVLRNKEDDFDFSIFDIKEDEPKPDEAQSESQETSTPKSEPLKAVKVFKKRKQIENRGPLSNYFVESSMKPTWSPSRSATSSPVINQGSFDRSPNFKSPKRPIRVAKETNANDTWDFLSNLSEDEDPKKKTMKLDLEEREQSKSLEPLSGDDVFSESNGIIESIESQLHDTQDDEPIEPVVDTQGSGSSQNANSSKIPRAKKGYGLQRSFLVEKDGGQKDDDINEEADTTINSEVNNETREGIHSINNLRAQGENAQYIDELNFILEGINSKSRASSLIELAIRLFDDSFSQFIKQHGLPNLQESIDLDNQLQLFTFGFILCKVTEDGNGSIVLDDTLVHAIIKSLGNSKAIDLKKESRMTKSAFEDLKSRLDEKYNSRFFALTLLIQNGLFMNDELFPHIIKIFKILAEDPSGNTKMINMTLLLLERYLTHQDEVNSQFHEVINQLLTLNELEMDCKVPSLKLLIVLSAKNFKPVFTVELVNTSILSCVENTDTPIGLLELGLLINLVENESCALETINKSNIKMLYKLQNQLGGEHKHYYSLLIGILIAKYSTELKKIFDDDEIIDIRHQLEAFEAKGNKIINLQVQEILSQLQNI